MVFHSLSKPKAPSTPLTTTPSSMASAFSTKSQPLHNFPLSKLRWSMSQRLQRIPQPTSSANDHSENRPVSPMKSPHHHHRSSKRHCDLVKSPNELLPSFPSLGRTEYGHFKFSGNFGSNPREKEEKSNTTSSIPSSEKKLGDFNGVCDLKEELLKNCDKKSKIFIQIPARNKVAAEASDAVKETRCGVEDEEPVAKT